MKYKSVLYLVMLFTFGCGHIETITRLQTDQKLLKDSANTLHEKIGLYMQQGKYDSAAVQKIQLGAVHARLTEIQSSIDSRSK